VELSDTKNAESLTVVMIQTAVMTDVTDHGPWIIKCDHWEGGSVISEREKACICVTVESGVRTFGHAVAQARCVIGKGVGGRKERTRGRYQICKQRRAEHGPKRHS